MPPEKYFTPVPSTPNFDKILDFGGTPLPQTVVRSPDGQVFAFHPFEVAGFHYYFHEGNRDPLLNAPTRTAVLSVAMNDGHIFHISSPLAELVLAVLDPKPDP